MVDDLDGNTADETVAFSLDGSAYEIDLSSANAEKLRQALAPFVAAARRAGATARHRPGHAGRDMDETPAIRRWARENGFEVNARGRIPADIKASYRSR